jgi:L-2-hydroxyglutarate oxidase LhgO
MTKSRLEGNIIKEYLEKFPNGSKSSLARKIYNDNKEVFNSVEQVRSAIRYYTGAQGKVNKKIVEKADSLIPRNKFGFCHF